LFSNLKEVSAKEKISSFAMKKNTFAVVLLLLISFTACQKEEKQEAFFHLIEGDQIGLDCQNDLQIDTDLNILNYLYYFNGGGVAVADFNLDGLQDLYFTRNEQSNRLCLNKGNFQFEDVTSRAGVAGMEGWTTGVSIVDINADGLPDIYVSQVGEYLHLRGKNQLFIHQGLDETGTPTFTEQAQEYGLDLVGLSTQAAFFDYDLDGDLDMFQLNHSTHRNGTFGKRGEFRNQFHPLAGDKLLENRDGKFVDVTKEAGIFSSAIGYGLGVVVSDINLDGFPDIYVGNDFHENDYLYLNEGDGTFREVLYEQMMHSSRFSMGVEAADLNNDGFNEILSLDMLPYDPFILKSSQGEPTYSIFYFKLKFGYGHQYARNNLQLNNRNGTFSEIGQMAGVYATDWSWAPLLMDFDNDGLKDIFISNGIPKRVNDLDYINFSSDPDTRWKIGTNDLSESDLSLLEKMPEIKLPNQFFLNKGKLDFQKLQNGIENNQPSYSNGAAFADLDNDGDLDIIVNNIYDPPFIYDNSAGEKNNYLKFSFSSKGKNKQGIGAKVLVFKGSEILFQENFPVRGYQSSVSPQLHMGIGDTTVVDSILIIWPDNHFEKLSPSSFNSMHPLVQKEGLPIFDYAAFRKRFQSPVSVQELSEEKGILFKHNENDFIEFDREPLIPHMTSTEGPAMAIADMNGDGLQDLFLGNAKWEKATFFLQTPNGDFTPHPQLSLEQDSIMEDVDACFADIDNDGDQDLLVASGGNEFKPPAPPLLPRLYLNDGQGNFSRKKDAFDEIYLTASCIIPHDFDNDGWIDLFLGGRAVPWDYGATPRSYLLRNTGNGSFEDVTQGYSSALESPGMVKDACWKDIDQDGDTDLLLALEWGPIRIFLRDGQSFIDFPLPESNGWWNCILPLDFDQDGDIDFIAGNLGMNTKLKASEKEPVRILIQDFDDNGKKEQILLYFKDGQEILLPEYMDITSALPSLKKEFLLASDFAKTPYDQMLASEKVREAKELVATVLENSYFENVGSKGEIKFKRHKLPNELQRAPIKTGLVHDFNQDGKPDFLLGGNFYENTIQLGRYDADYGSLIINEDGKFKEQNIYPLQVKGQIRNIQAIQIGRDSCYIFAPNDDFFKVLNIQFNNEIQSSGLYGNLYH
jgi:hypothetical protein